MPDTVGLPSIDRRVEALAATQFGRFTRAQVATLVPGSRSLVQSRLRSGRWRRETSRVLVLPGAPVNRTAALWVAWLHLGEDTAVSHLGAAHVLGFPSVPADHVRITTPAGAHRSLAGVVVHQRADLAPIDVVTVGGLRVTSAPRTLADCGPLVSRRRLAAWLDHCLTERIVTIGQVREVLERLRRPNKRGLEPLVDVVGERLDGPGVESNLAERKLTAVLLLAGLPTGMAQYPLPTRPGEPDGLVDRAFPELGWIIEVDSRRWHARAEALTADRARDRSATVLGWHVTRVTFEELRDDPGSVAEDLRRIHTRLVVDAAVRRRAAGDSGVGVDGGSATVAP